MELLRQNLSPPEQLSEWEEQQERERQLKEELHQTQLLLSTKRQAVLEAELAEAKSASLLSTEDVLDSGMAPQVFASTSSADVDVQTQWDVRSGGSVTGSRGAADSSHVEETLWTDRHSQSERMSMSPEREMKCSNSEATAVLRQREPGQNIPHDPRVHSLGDFHKKTADATMMLPNDSEMHALSSRSAQWNMWPEVRQTPTQ